MRQPLNTLTRMCPRTTTRRGFSLLASLILVVQSTWSGCGSRLTTMGEIFDRLLSVLHHTARSTFCRLAVLLWFSSLGTLVRGSFRWMAVSSCASELGPSGRLSVPVPRARSWTYLIFCVTHVWHCGRTQPLSCCSCCWPSRAFGWVSCDFCFWAPLYVMAGVPRSVSFDR